MAEGGNIGNFKQILCLHKSYFLKIKKRGLASGRESALQCKGCRFDRWSGNQDPTRPGAAGCHNQGSCAPVKDPT